MLLIITAIWNIGVLQREGHKICSQIKQFEFKAHHLPMGDLEQVISLLEPQIPHQQNSASNSLLQGVCKTRIM